MRAIGQLRHRVTLATAGEPVPDGYGGYTDTLLALDPAIWDCSIQPATLSDMQRIVGGTPQATATHLIRGRYHPGITVETRITTWKGQAFEVQSVQNDEQRDWSLTLVCAEIVNRGGA